MLAAAVGRARTFRLMLRGRTGMDGRPGTQGAPSLSHSWCRVRPRISDERAGSRLASLAQVPHRCPTCPDRSVGDNEEMALDGFHGAGVLLVTLLAIAAPDAIAQEAERFAPTPGTEYELRSTTVSKSEGRPDVRTEAHIGARVVSNDGLFSTRLTRLIGAATDGPGPAAQPTEFSAGNQVTTMAFIPTQIAVRTLSSGSGAEHVMLTRTDCDKGPLLAFLLLGRLPSVTLVCTTVQTFDGVPRSTVRSERTLFYERRSTVTTPAGTFPVQGVRMTYRVGSETLEVRLLVDTRTGVTPCYETWTSAPGRTTHTVAELARVSGIASRPSRDECLSMKLSSAQAAVSLAVEA